MKLAKIVENIVVSASTYVQITRKEFEDWLDSTKFRSKWKLKDNTAGVYSVSLSDKVGIEISSSIGREDQVMGLGNAAIQMRMVSLITGLVLNKKAQGQDHFKRTTGWRNSLTRGLDSFYDTYIKSQSFYDTLAKIENREKYKQEMKKKIESVPNWEKINDLQRMHQRVESGGVLNDRDEADIERHAKGEIHVPAVQEKSLDETLMAKMRKLWAIAKNSGDNWLKDFTESVGQQYKFKGTLSPKQLEILEKGFQKYRVAKDTQEFYVAAEFFDAGSEEPPM